MTTAGIQAMYIYGGAAYLDVTELARHRQLDNARFENLLIKQKTVALPWEDPVTFAVNAAKPIVDMLSDAEKNRIELLITCTESGIDFGKSLSTYVHHYLGLSRNCRLFEIKQACYSGTAGFQMALNFILSGVSPGARALVVTTDISRFTVAGRNEAPAEDWSFAEPSSGAGGVAMLVSGEPTVFRADVGANGYYGHEVMDACRPLPDSEAGNVDLSLMTYMECSQQAYLEYRKRVTEADYRSSFQYLAFHTPFGGMVKGAHRTIMRKIVKASPDEIELDFMQRVAPGLNYCQRVGNIMGGTVFMSLASIIDNGNFDAPRRIGCFSYGSGCCSEFYSGMVTGEGQKQQQRLRIREQLDRRYRMSVADYERIVVNNTNLRFGMRDVTPDFHLIPEAWDKMNNTPQLYLKEIRDFHRKYEWR
ncbi:MAG TPA: hydroxymethylglutaryl-CoA synthase family protein [Chitinophaga sp.]|uniref:hydroxymethylglutaryl-CoA synthase family protein n=1 Tax=Chitinophaga sp. TaxID=1869181 RepID=UPI002C6D0639|nr:hydroxymethylglutaryl-CoA synthase family protein [Chitinophaga sp.]HVI46507.1 hydroxymethylglutaryl-CoA synthase family protein [Chitinophaga sp.]